MNRIIIISLILIASSCGITKLINGKKGGGEDLKLGCMISSNPASVTQAGQKVTLTLQLKNATDVKSVKLDGTDLSIGGGTKEVVINENKTFNGEVKTATETSTCSVEVKIASNNPDYCVLKPTSDHVKQLSAKITENRAKNLEVFNQLVAAEVAKDKMTDVSDAKEFVSSGYGYGADLKFLCKEVNSAWVANQCQVTELTSNVSTQSAKVVKLVPGPSDSGKTMIAVLLQVSDKDDTVYAKGKINSAGKAIVFFGKKNYKEGNQVPVNRCECDSVIGDGGFAPSTDQSDSAGIAAVYTKVYTFSIDAANAPESIKEIPFDFIYSTYKFTEIPPPAGKAKPKCVQTYEPAT